MAEMTTQDIVKNAEGFKGDSTHWEQVYASIARLLETDKYRMFRTGNTLFLVQIKSPGVAEMFTFNADTKHGLIKNIQEFLAAMKKANYHTVYGNTFNVQILRLLQRTGYSVDIQQLPDEDGKPLFRGTFYG
jgi:hypothetical protein